MVLRRRVELAATSRADDLALRALAEIVEITSDENVRIVATSRTSLAGIAHVAKSCAALIAGQYR